MKNLICGVALALLALAPFSFERANAQAPLPQAPLSNPCQAVAGAGPGGSVGCQKVDANHGLPVSIVGGSAGGGPVTIANGADVVAGSTTDTAYSDATGAAAGTLDAIIKGTFIRVATAANQTTQNTTLNTLFKSGQNIGNTGFNVLQGAVANSLTNPFYFAPSTGATWAATQSGTWNDIVTNAGTFPVQNTAAIPTGTNLIGSVTLGASATNSPPTFSVQRATGTNFVAAGAVSLYGWDLATATATNFCFLDTATPPSGSASITPQFCIAAAANTTLHERHDIPDHFTTGLVIVSTSSLTTETAVTPQIITALYK